MKTPEKNRQNLAKKGYQGDIKKNQTIMKTPENDRQNLDKRSYKRDRADNYEGSREYQQNLAKRGFKRDLI